MAQSLCPRHLDIHQGTDQRSGRMRQVQWSTTEEGQGTWRGRDGGGAPVS